MKFSILVVSRLEAWMFDPSTNVRPWLIIRTDSKPSMPLLLAIDVVWGSICIEI
jgi:hypothetical protein